MNHLQKPKKYKGFLRLFFLVFGFKGRLQATPNPFWASRKRHQGSRGPFLNIGTDHVFDGLVDMLLAVSITCIAG